MGVGVGRHWSRGRGFQPICVDFDLEIQDLEGRVVFFELRYMSQDLAHTDGSHIRLAVNG